MPDLAVIRAASKPAGQSNLEDKRPNPTIIDSEGELLAETTQPGKGNNQPLMKVNPTRCFKFIILNLAFIGWAGVAVAAESPMVGSIDEVHDQIDELIRQFRVVEARQLIDSVLSDHPHDHRAQMARRALANTYLRMGNRLQADLQFEKLSDYLLSYPRQSRPLLKHLPQILVNMSSIQQSIEPQASQRLDRAIALLRQATEENPRNVAWSGGLISVIGMKASGLQKRGQFEAFEALYDAELDRLRNRWREQPENPDAWLSMIAVLNAATLPENIDYQSTAAQLQAERTNLLELAVKRFPQSDALVQEYVIWRQQQASDVEAYSSETARRMLSQTRHDFDEITRQRGHVGSLLKTRIQLEKRLERLNRQLARRSLIGNRIPEMGEIDWLNGDVSDWKMDEGRATILTFFSVRRDQSIRALIELNDLIQRQFPQVRLIALTHEFEQPYDQLYTPRRKPLETDQPNRDLYRQKMKQEIIATNGFRFPIGISRHSPETASSFGISRLPYTALYDVDGICRQVFDGPVPTGRLAKAAEALQSSAVPNGR